MSLATAATFMGADREGWFAGTDFDWYLKLLAGVCKGRNVGAKLKAAWKILGPIGKDLIELILIG